MNDLKPVAWLCVADDGNIDAATTDYQRDSYARFGRKIIPLIPAIPSTHRVVSVETLRHLTGEGDSMQVLDAWNEVRAIIDNKERS